MVIKRSQTTRKESPGLIIEEYPSETNLKDLQIAVGRIDGPQKTAVNRVCFEIIHIIDGSISVTMDGKTETAESGDQIVILPNVPYTLDGHANFMAATSPAFFPEQHVFLE